MEDKKDSSYSSIADELFGSKEESSGHFSNIFPPASSVKSYSAPSKKRHEGSSANAHAAAAEDKHQGITTKAQSKHNNKDGKPIYPTETAGAPYFGSDVHYGGRDFYTGPAPENPAATSKSYTNSEEDSTDDSNFATRGDWWQGSLYY